jgi:hypothetical protein
MPVTYVSGDPALTRAQTLALGHNRKGRTELGRLETALMQRYPAAFSSYMRQCKKGRLNAGAYWLWRDSIPRLMFMTVRDSAVGATRLRYVQSIAMTLARDYRLEGLKSLAIAPLGNAYEWIEIMQVLETWLERTRLQIVIYQAYEPGVAADEAFEASP